MNKVPHPHQWEAIDRLRDSLRAGKRRPMLQASTGFGKTLLASMIVEGALAREKRVAFVVPFLSLIDQTVEAFRAEGIDAIGVMQGFHELSDKRQPVQICSVDTLRARGIFPECDIGIIDEAHRWTEYYARWFAQAAHPIIGLSATPWTKALGKHYDDLIVVRTTAQLIETGFLSPFRVFAPSSPDLTGVRTRHGDFAEGDLARVMSEKRIVADVVETWLAKGEGRPTLCFAVNRAHAKILEQSFRNEGVTCAYVDAYTSKDERADIRQQFQAGGISVIVNIATMTTGVDLDVRCIILARPTKSEMLYVQIVGRGLRPVYAPWFDTTSTDTAERVRAIAEGPKPDCLILDHSDTTTRLGFVTDIVHEHLDDGRGRGPMELRIPQPRPGKCPTCGFVKAPKMIVCPACGHTPAARNTVTVEAGELIEVRGQLPQTRDKAPMRRREWSAKERWDLFGQLKHYGLSKGYKTGWAVNQFKELTRQYPDGVESAPPTTPGPELLNWIKSRQIAYAKGRAKGAGGRWYPGASAHAR